MTVKKKLLKKDIVIIGAGPAGLSLACSLADSGLEVLIVEKAPKKLVAKPKYDGREIALTHFSVDVLKNFGAWEMMNSKCVAPIEKAKVVSGNSDYSLNFDRSDARSNVLGYLVSNHEIRKSLFEAVSGCDNVEIIYDREVVDVCCKDDYGDGHGEVKSKVTLSDGTVVESALSVAADSRFSESRRKMGISADMHDFAKVMVLCRMKHELSHEKTARECFFYDRVIATLPMSGNMSSIVMSVNANEVDDIMTMDDKEFAADAYARLGDKFGKMEVVGEKYSYPLVGVYARKFYAERFVLVGDAAVGMHPVTAHGFNLGLKGQDTLTREIKQALARGEDFGSNEVLRKYQRQHVHDTKPLYLGTNAVIALFTNNMPIAKVARKLALRVANSKLLPVKKMITNRLNKYKRISTANFFQFR